MIIAESARSLKSFVGKTGLKPVAQRMVMRMVLAFIQRPGRMSCSQAACSIASEPIHCGELTRFLARRRWQKPDFNAPLGEALLGLE